MMDVLDPVLDYLTDVTSWVHWDSFLFGVGVMLLLLVINFTRWLLINATGMIHDLLAAICGALFGAIYGLLFGKRDE